MSRLSLRIRLALLIGLLLAVAGTALLSISYGLVSSNLNAPLAATPPAVPQSQARAHVLSSTVPRGTAPSGGVAPEARTCWPWERSMPSPDARSINC